MNRTTLGNVKDGGPKSPVGNSKLKNRVQPSKNGKNPAPNNNPTPSTTLGKRQVPPTTKQKSQPLKGNPEIQPNTNNSNKKDLNKNSTKGKPQVLPAKPANTNNTPKKSTASGNPSTSKTNNSKANIGSKPQQPATQKNTPGTKSTTNTNATPKKSAAPGNPAASQTNDPKTNVGLKPQQPATQKNTPETKNTTNANATPKKGPASGNPAASTTNNPKTDAGSNSQSIDGPKNSTLEQPKAPNIQPNIEQVNQIEDITKLIQTNQIKLIKGSLNKVLNNWKLCDAALRLAYGDDYYSKLQKDYSKLRQDRLELKVEKYKCSLADSAKTAIPLPAGESPKALNSQEQIKALLKKNKTELMKIEDSRYNISTIAFFTELAPQIVDATRSDTLDATFIKGICEQIQQMVQKTSPRIYLNSLDLSRIRDTVHENFPERSLESLQREQIEQLLKGYSQISLESLDMLQISFRRLLDPQVLQAFRDHINDYLQQIRAAQGDAALQTRIEERLQAFVYNFLVPPYQHDNEGSCFATAFLMNMWYNSPIDYMRFIRWAIDTDGLFDLAKVGGRGIIDLRALKKGDKITAIKRILVAMVASIYESSSSKRRKNFLNQGVSIIKSEIKSSKNMPVVSDPVYTALAILKYGIAYMYGRWTPISMLKKYGEKTTDVLNEKTEIFKNEIPNLDHFVASQIATSFFTKIYDTEGSDPKYIVQNLAKNQHIEEKQINFDKPIEDGIFTKEQIKSLFDELKNGPKGKFAIITLLYVDKKGNPDGGHACNIVIDDSYETMQPGESRRFINMNYLDEIHSSSWVRIKNIGSDKYQLEEDGRPFSPIIKTVITYSISKTNENKNTLFGFGFGWEPDFKERIS